MQDPNCLFCRIVRKEIPAREVFRDDHVVAFHDVNPQAPVHVLVVPVEHAAHLSDFTANAADEVGARILRTASRIGNELGRNGYRVVMNEGPDAGQTVNHLHAHVLAGRFLSWPPG